MAAGAARLAGVVEATVAAMAALGARADRIRAGIGPCIAQPSYEVGPEFRDRFAADDRGQRGLFRRRRRGTDISSSTCRVISRSRLARLGLAAVERSGRTTPSPRRSGFSAIGAPACAAKRDYGRGLAAIALVRIAERMPYLILFAAFCLLGLLVTCALL